MMLGGDISVGYYVWKSVSLSLHPSGVLVRSSRPLLPALNAAWPSQMIPSFIGNIMGATFLALPLVCESLHRNEPSEVTAKNNR